MPEKVIVLVADQDDPKHGEITVLEGRERAERMVETLLEAGFQRERIRVFTGSEMEVEITHRPVVSLVAQGLSSGEWNEAPEGEEEPEPVEAGLDQEPEKSIASGAYTQGGVRFSSMFRSA